MSCFDEKTLYEYFDGILEADESGEVEKHLKDCPACQKKVNELKAFEKGLKSFWRQFRKNCPTPEKLYEHSLGKMPKEEATKISEHLEFCQICKTKYEESEKIAAELEQLAKEELREGIPGIQLSEINKGLIKKLVEAINLAETSKVLKESFEKFWKSHFGYERPIGLRALAPSFEQAYVADTGEGFEKEVIQEESSPFQIEIDQFGTQLTIVLSTTTDLFKNSIVRFHLFEKGEKRYSGVLFVSDGKGKHEINLGDKGLEKPEEEPYRIKLDVLSSMEILSDIRDPSSSKILMELMKSGDPEIIKLITEIIEKRRDREQ
jgi:hypothetical protein